MEFDLGWLCRIDRKGKGYRAYIRGGTALMCCFGDIWLVSRLLAAPRSGVHQVIFEEGLISVILIGFIAYMLVVSLPVFLPGAEAITVDDEGVYLVYPGNRHENLRFEDSRLRVTMLDFSSQPEWVRANYTYRMRRRRGLPILGPYYRSSLLSREAFDAVLAAARNRGLSVRSHRASEYSPTPGALVYEIRGRAV